MNFDFNMSLKIIHNTVQIDKFTYQYRLLWLIMSD